VAKAAATLPGGHFIMIAGARAAVLWLGVLALAWWLWNSPRRPWMVAARVAFVAVLISWTTLFYAFRRLSVCQCLTVSFLDVGQGDAIALRSPAGRWLPPRRGDRMELDGVTIDVLSPDSAWAVSQTDINEESVVLLVTYGSTRLLLAGDAGIPTEARLAGQVGPVTLLKVGHHGSRGATSDRWLDELRPAEA